VSTELIEHLRSAVGTGFVIERELAGGGMARVFLATDTALQRPVVIKVLPPETAGLISTERFRREIGIAARMQHAHIVPVLGAGDVGGLAWFTMPFIEGESLRVGIARHGELPLPDAVRILREIASALAYAHAHHVVHRDIKPENVLMAGGAAMVTDFGVAKALSASTVDGGSGLTSLGVSLGTPAYMAPEQASADPLVDHRADLYAWGVVAYELLSGQPPFAGRPPQAMLVAHVTEQPEDVVRRRHTIPPALGALVMRCLEKRPADRPQRAEDLMHALDALSTPTGTVPAVAIEPFSQRRRRLLFGLATALVVLGGGAAASAFWNRLPPPVIVESDQPLLTSDELELDAAISPNGRKVAYAVGPAGRHRIFVRQIGGDRSVLVSGDEPGSHRWPRWSPDGERIAFAANDGIHVIAETGGSWQTVARRGSFPAWSPDGTQIAFADSNAIWVAPVGGGTRRLVIDRAAAALAWSPDGSFIAYNSGNAGAFLVSSQFNITPTRIYVVPANGGRRVAVTDSIHMSVSPAWSADGRSLFFVSNMNGPREIFEQPLRKNGSPFGAPRRIGSGRNAHSLTASADGRTIAFSTLELRSPVWSAPISRSGPTAFSAARPVTRRNESVEGMAVSADGNWLFYDSNVSGNSEIYKARLGADGVAGDGIQLTRDPDADFAPTPSPDGKEIAFYSTRAGTRDIWVMQADGTGLVRVTDLPSSEYHPRWSPDGKRLTYYSGHTSYVSDRDGSGRWSPPRVVSQAGPSGGFTTDGGSVIAFGGQGITRIPLAPGASAVRLSSSTLPGRTGLPVLWNREIFFHQVEANVHSFWSMPESGGKPRLLLRMDDPAHSTRRSEFHVGANRLFFTVAMDEGDVHVLTLRR
jgi:serine/threonine protein kinase/Tol biopolymer transport system component